MAHVEDENVEAHWRYYTDRKYTQYDLDTYKEKIMTIFEEWWESFYDHSTKPIHRKAIAEEAFKAGMEEAATTGDKAPCTGCCPCGAVAAIRKKLQEL